MDDTPNLTLPLILAAQAQKHVTHNEALRALDALVQLSVETIDLTAPPTAPGNGMRYVVADAATGAWAGRERSIAAYQDGAWVFFAPNEGWLAWVADRDSLVVFDGSTWVPCAGGLTSVNPVALVGVNTTADTTNRLAVKSNAVLFAHDDVTPGTGDMRVTLDKSTAAKDAGFVFQTGWSSRALFGLLGTDDFVLKVSPDGSAFVTALTVDRTTGRVALGVDLPVSEGGTGASTPARARWNLGFRPDVPKRNRVTGAAWLVSTSAADNDWRSVCWAAELGLLVAVAGSGTGSRVMTSPDGITWTARTSAVDNDWRSVCWSPELKLLVAVGTTGTGNRVMTSPDGLTWTTRTSASDAGWLKVIWAAELGLFVALAGTGSGGCVMTSPDGITWTLRTTPTTNYWDGLCWAAELGLLVAVAATGTGNRVMTSPDGVTWTARTSAVDNSWFSVCWAAELGLLVAVAYSGTGNRVMTSPDGLTWTTRTSAVDNNWYSVCWAAELGLLVAVAGSGIGNRVMTSPDGITWTARTSAVDNDWISVCWAAALGLFVAVGKTGTGNRVTTSVSAHSLAYRSA
jgi:hypothetical protein